MNLSPLRIRLLVGALFVVSFLGALDHTIVSTSLATIAGELDALAQMSWIIVAYTLASTVLMPVIGRLGDMIGPRLVFLVSLAVFLAASLACGFAPGMTALIVARVVQGVGSAGLHLMSQTIVAHVTTPRQRARYMSVIGAAFPVAILAGPVLGGVIVDTWGWPWVFWINLPLGGAALAFAAFALPHVESGAERGRIDVAGALAFAVAMVSLVLAVTWLGDPAALGAGLACAALSATGFAVFVLVEFRASHPLVPLRLFADRRMAASTALSAVIGVGLFSVTAYLPTFFQMAYRTSATVSGLVPIATVFGMLVSSLFSGWLVGRTGRYRRFAIAGPLLASFGLGAMAVLPLGLPLWVPMALMALVGIGTGLFMSLVVAVAQSSAPRSATGAATAAVNLVRQIGSTVATAIVGGVIGAGVAAALVSEVAALTPQEVHAAPAAVQDAVARAYGDVMGPVFGALALVYLLGFVIALLLPAGRLSDEHAPAHPPAAEPTRLVGRGHPIPQAAAGGPASSREETP
ncbi:MDR family MFS transporter [Microbacterium sp. JZ37]|uniref:MDR family MFS transporter n=1 Tax=Microbacterium sp. JZ37 TaxID=2654193 RepID=UPI002B46C789|nr:MDR family MFS transporter [Microbacterium sp. JZ37]WRH16326.1 MFS transporter [Microbacterium sp. JZ37]